MDSLSIEELHRLSYVDLKQYAKKQGVKKTNVKAEKLISAILSANARADETLESFNMCDERLYDSFLEGNNSSEDSEIEIKTPRLNIKKRAKKICGAADVTSMENKSWTEDSEIGLKTPSILKRSNTFSVELPVTPLEKQPRLRDADFDISDCKHQSRKVRAASTMKVSIVPTEKQDISVVQEKETISEDQIYLISALPPKVTPANTHRRSILRHGEKGLPVKNAKFSGNKVNFITPDRRLLRRSVLNSGTPFRSVKDRPKTPVAAKQSAKRKRVQSPFPEKSPKHAKTVNDQVTPISSSIRAGRTKLKLDKGLQAGTPMAKSAERKPVGTVSGICSANFTKIHKKAFDRMENIEEYQERLHNRMATLTGSQKRSKKEVTFSIKRNAQKNHTPEKLHNSKTEQVSLKPSRIPQPFRGIPFIPVVKSIRKIDTNFADQTRGQIFLRSTSKSHVGNENENPGRRCQRTLFTPESASTVFWFGKSPLQDNSSSVAAGKHSQKKFDLKASLAKKLPYKPYRGVLRPLSDTNANQSHLNASCFDPIKKKREQSREILKGVRKNRRFELQMSHRGIS